MDSLAAHLANGILQRIPEKKKNRYIQYTDQIKSKMPFRKIGRTFLLQELPTEQKPVRNNSYDCHQLQSVSKVLISSGTPLGLLLSKPSLQYLTKVETESDFNLRMKILNCVKWPSLSNYCCTLFDLSITLRLRKFNNDPLKTISLVA